MPKRVIPIRHDADRHGWFMGFLDRLSDGI